MSGRDAVPPVPPYGRASLADLMPSVLAGLGVGGEQDRLGIGLAQRVVLLLVDGLGLALLRRHPASAPFLSSLSGPSLSSGFPSTTAVSLTSLGTGLPPGEHGVTGYTSQVPEAGGTVSWLTWTRDGADLRETFVPERVQPCPTAFERAAADGVGVTVTTPARFGGSGLTRAALRGGRWQGSVTSGDTVAQAVAAAAGPGRRLVYAYTPDLDLVGHVRGVDSDAWREQLHLVDALAARLADRVPAGTRLLVTADHGMVDVAPEDQVDLDARPDLADGLVAVAGEPRARHLHVRDGAAADVAATWRDALAGRAAVLTRDEVCAAGLLGPVVSPQARERTGDVVVLATGRLAVVRRRTEPRAAALVGHHGALTDDETAVPLLVHDA